MSVAGNRKCLQTFRLGKHNTSGTSRC